MNPAVPTVLRAARLLDPVRERIRYKHYSLGMESGRVRPAMPTDRNRCRTDLGWPLQAGNAAY